MAFRDINPGAVDPLAWNQLVGNIGANVLAGEQRGIQNAVSMNQLAMDAAKRNALAAYYGAPEDQRASTFNQLAAVDPTSAANVLQIQQAQTAMRQAEEREQALKMYSQADAVLRSENPLRAFELLDEDGSGSARIREARQQYDLDGDGEITAEEVQAFMQDVKAYYGPLAGITSSAEDGFTLSPGQTRFTAGGAPIASLPGDTSGADNPFSDISTKDYTAESIAAFQRSAQRGNADYSLLVPRDEGEKPISLDQVRSVRNDVIRNSEDFRQRQMAYENVVSASSNPSPANDLALLFAVAKVYDPGSIVREGELQISQSAGDIAQRLGASFKQVFQGERLTDGQRRDFVESARAQFESSNKQQQRLIADARGFAERNKLPIDDVVPSYLMPADLGAGSTGRGGRNSPTTAQRAGNAVEQAIDRALAPQANIEQYQDGTTVEWLD